MTTYQGQPDTAAPADAGAVGNARLTAANGTLLIVLLAAEGVTVLDVRGLISWHVFVGILLIGPVLLKTASTGYRFVRYYTGRADYVSHGPPHPVLRIIGPLVILSSLLLLGTGVALLAYKPDSAGFLLTVHKASFFAWFALMTVHVLGHLREALLATWQELRPRRIGRRRAIRLSLIALALLVGVGGAAAIYPHAGNWTSARLHGDGPHEGR